MLFQPWARPPLLPQKRIRKPRDTVGRRAGFRPAVELLEDRTLLAWTPVAGMPTPRSDLAATTGTNGLIYALGGADASHNPLIINEAYNTGSNTWTELAGMSQQRFGLAAATGTDGRIFAIGGSTFHSATNSVEAYTPSVNTWMFVSNLNTFRFDLAAALGPDGRIYAIGGTGFSGVTNVVEAYTLASNVWQAVAPMPTARSALAAVTAPDGRIYAIGGANATGTPLSTVEAYTPAMNTWTTVASLPTARLGLAAAVGPDGRIFVMGGTDVNGAIVSTVEAYAPTTNTWTEELSMPTARTALAAATGPDGRIYAIGGRNAVGPLATVEAFTVSLPPNPLNQAFVAQAFRDLLHREADAAGLSSFTTILNQGLATPFQVALAIEVSLEYRTQQVEAIYQAFLHRPADPQGLAGSLQFLAAGGTFEQLQAIIAGSQEFLQDSGGTNDGFLNALYQDALGRTPDAGGRAFFDRALAAGFSRTQVAAAVLTSPEHAQDFVTGLYLQFLHRSPDSAGLAGFVNDSLQGVRDEVVIALIVGSAEYFGRL